jgi:hypothetical protein
MHRLVAGDPSGVDEVRAVCLGADVGGAGAGVCALVCFSVRMCICVCVLVSACMTFCRSVSVFLSVRLSVCACACRLLLRQRTCMGGFIVVPLVSLPTEFEADIHRKADQLYWAYGRWGEPSACASDGPMIQAERFTETLPKLRVLLVRV